MFTWGASHRPVGRSFLGRALAALALLATLAGPLTPAVGAAGLPTNSWLALRHAGAPTIIQGSCALGGATAGSGRSSVWAAIAGGASLDIVQIGAIIGPTGRRYFAAYGRGEPNAAGSLYVERDLGAANPGTHQYSAILLAGTWYLSIDGAVRMTIPDTFRTWVIRSSQVATETEAGAPIGGTAANPVSCSTNGAWTFVGGGPEAGSAQETFGSNWFRAWR
jgi:hypothetical protein